MHSPQCWHPNNGTLTTSSKNNTARDTLRSPGVIGVCSFVKISSGIVIAFSTNNNS
jgi:hypothetical protein